MNNPSVLAYKSFAEFYDFYVGSYSEDLEFYKSCCNRNDKIIEIGCGTGRVLKHFLENNFSIEGVDISEEMLLKAEQKLSLYTKNKMLKLSNHDFAIEPTKNLYTKALVTFYTFNYILDKPEKFLENIYNSLANYGVLIMDLFYPKTLANTKIENSWTEQSLNFKGRNLVVKDKRNIKDRIENRIQIYLIDEIETSIETSRRYFSPDEISFLLLKCGFCEIEFSTRFEITSFSKTIDEQSLKQNFVVKAKKIEK
jgi:SAM-dependent methyltransferase